MLSNSKIISFHCCEVATTIIWKQKEGEAEYESSRARMSLDMDRTLDFDSYSLGSLTPHWKDLDVSFFKVIKGHGPKNPPKGGSSGPR